MVLTEMLTGGRGRPAAADEVRAALAATRDHGGPRWHG
jgi:hypothetical protein